MAKAIAIGLIVLLSLLVTSGAVEACNGRKAIIGSVESSSNMVNINKEISAPEVTKKKSGGSSFQTQWCYDSQLQEYKKKDVYFRPFLSKIEDVDYTDKRFIILPNPSPEGYVWRARLITGRYGYVPNYSGWGIQYQPQGNEPECDGKPLFYTWYRNLLLEKSSNSIITTKNI